MTSEAGGTVTLLFTDVVGSTVLATGRGDERAHAILQQQRALVRQQVEEHAGREVKTMGDGFMVAFGSARQAVACAIGIQQTLERQAREKPDAAVQVRIGLTTGEAIPEGSDLFGTVVNAASRVMDKASGGEILVSESVRQVLGAGTEFRLADRGHFRLKGFPERWRLYEVLWRTEPSEAASPGAEGLPFIGRDAERARVNQALDGATSARGSILLIGGEAGVGKTRLAEECAVEGRRRGFLTLVGRCYENSSAPPYGPFVEIVEAAVRGMPPAALRAALAEDVHTIAQLVPDVRESVSSFAAARPYQSMDKQSLFAAFREFLKRAASAQPLVIVLDDLQWADVASLQLLRFLSRDLQAMRVLVIVTYRDTQLDAASPFAQTLDELHVKRLAVEIELEPFGVDAVEALLLAASGRPPPSDVVRTLHAETNGNAFFIEELYRHLAEEGRLFDEAGEWRGARRISAESLPKGLRLVIERRLSRLTTPTRQLLDAAAVLGTTFDIPMLEAAASIGGDQLVDCLDEAERARIVTPDTESADGRYRFTHPLTRSVIVSSLASSQRQRLHARAASAVEACVDRTPALDAQLAYHYHAAGRLADGQLAIAAWRRAASAALNAYANVEAAAHLAAATKLAERQPGFPGGDLADIVHRFGQSQYRLGAWDASRTALDRALSLYAKTGDANGQAHVLYSKSSLATFESRPGDSLRFLAHARDLTPDDESLRGLILMLESQNLVDLRQYENAERAKDEAIAIAERLADPYIVNRARIASGYFALATLDMKRAVDDFARVAEANAASSHERLGAESRRAIALACIGALNEGEERGNRARGYFRSMRDVDDAFDDPAAERDPYEFGLSCLATGIATIARGRFAETYSFLREAVEGCGSPPNVRVVRTLTPLMLQALYCLGRHEEAEPWLDALAPPNGDRPTAFRRLFAVLQTAARGDAPAPAHDLPSPPARRPDLQSLAVTTLAAETAVAVRDADGARLQLEALEYLRDRGMTFTAGWVALIPRLLGAAYTLVGEEVRAESTLESALVHAQSSGASAELALVRLEFAELYAARGAQAEARASLAQAQSLFAALGMRSCDARAGALQAGLKPVESPGVDGLTDQEAAILRLVAAGLHNRAVAQECSMTVSALQRQLTSLYHKIGVVSRVEAIAYAYRTGIARGSA